MRAVMRYTNHQERRHEGAIGMHIGGDSGS